jgi:hypothetical protein
MAGSKLENAEVIQELINLIKVGNYLGTACAAVGVSEVTYYKWMKIGADVEEFISGHKDEEELKERMEEGEVVLYFSVHQVRCWNFRREVQKATAMGEAYAVAMVRSQMPQQWTAAMTFLERRFPHRWKRREQIDVGEAEATTGIDESLLLQDPEAVKLIHDALDKAARGQLPKPADDESVIDAEVIQDDEKPLSQDG